MAERKGAKGKKGGATVETEAGAPKAEATEAGAPEAEIESGIEAEPVSEPEAQPAEEAAEAPAEDDRVGELEAELAAAKDQLLRALAETENVRRRADKEREGASKYAISNFAKDLLAVADNLRRALDAIPEDARDGEDSLKTLADGVELTEKQLLVAFERHGITKIEPMGEPFDHNFHQAVFEVEDANSPAGTVVQLIQLGYLINDRLLRAAMVGVAKGGPREEEGDDAPRVDTTA